MTAVEYKSEEITKLFRKFNGNLCVQINGGKWLELKNTTNPELIQQLVDSKVKDTLESVIIGDNQFVVGVTENKYKNIDKQLLKRIREIYRH